MIIPGLLRTKIKINMLEDVVDSFGESTDTFTTLLTTWSEIVSVDVDRVDSDDPKLIKRLTLKVRNRESFLSLTDNLQIEILTGDHMGVYEVQTVNRQNDECVFALENYGKV